MKNNSIIKYLWLLPALYVAYAFCGKLFEVMADNQEFVDIISVITPLAPISNIISYVVGVFDFVIGLSVLIIPLYYKTRKYSTYIFIWTTLWVFIPASLRYFGGAADFEVVEVLSISFASILSFLLYKKFNKK